MVQGVKVATVRPGEVRSVQGQLSLHLLQITFLWLKIISLLFPGLKVTFHFSDQSSILLKVSIENYFGFSLKKIGISGKQEYIFRQTNFELQ